MIRRQRRYCVIRLILGLTLWNQMELVIYHHIIVLLSRIAYMCYVVID